jgi:hypothetical protein
MNPRGLRGPRHLNPDGGRPGHVHAVSGRRLRNVDTGGARHGSHHVMALRPREVHTSTAVVRAVHLEGALDPPLEVPRLHAGGPAILRRPRLEERPGAADDLEARRRPVAGSDDDDPTAVATPPTAEHHRSGPVRRVARGRVPDPLAVRVIAERRASVVDTAVVGVAPKRLLLAGLVTGLVTELLARLLKLGLSRVFDADHAGWSRLPHGRELRTIASGVGCPGLLAPLLRVRVGVPEIRGGRGAVPRRLRRIRRGGRPVHRGSHALPVGVGRVRNGGGAVPRGVSTVPLHRRRGAVPVRPPGHDPPGTRCVEVMPGPVPMPAVPPVPASRRPEGWPVVPAPAREAVEGLDVRVALARRNPAALDPLVVPLVPVPVARLPDVALVRGSRRHLELRLGWSLLDADKLRLLLHHEYRRGRAAADEQCGSG